MGILAVTTGGIGDAHVVQDLDGLVLGSFALQALVQLEGFLDLPANGLQGIQGGHGVLHDHGDLLTADLAPVLFALELGQIHALIQDGTGIHPAVFIQQADEVFTEDGFALSFEIHLQFFSNM